MSEEKFLSILTYLIDYIETSSLYQLYNSSHNIRNIIESITCIDTLCINYNIRNDNDFLRSLHLLVFGLTLMNNDNDDESLDKHCIIKKRYNLKTKVNYNKISIYYNIDSNNSNSNMYTTQLMIELLYRLFPPNFSNVNMSKLLEFRLIINRY